MYHVCNGGLGKAEVPGGRAENGTNAEDEPDVEAADVEAGADVDATAVASVRVSVKGLESLATGGRILNILKS
jgi:hypothetical protein